MLYAWLQTRFQYSGDQTGALAYFKALPVLQQAVFVDQVFFDELKAGGREYNDPSSGRYQSYLRGRDAIAALFPGHDASGAPIARGGDITMYGGSGIHTDFGGAINVLDPGGETLLGVEQGATPPSTAGVVTQGAGSIDIYSLGSVLLGQSRILTSYGGDILVWSAQGDINAGRGSKTTTVFQPQRRIYDNYGNVALAPTVPTSGAGIATLAPIPEVPPGNVDLIAPLGIIDAGEAGIRVSGNVNLAAVQIVNAANIQAQGKTTGLPTVEGPPVAALTSANSTAGAGQQTAAPEQQKNDRPSVIIVEVVGYGGAGGDDGTSPQPQQDQKRSNSGEQRSYNANGNVRVLGYSTLTDSEMTDLTEAEKQAIRN
jgi:hypothetical protein